MAGGWKRPDTSLRNKSEKTKTMLRERLLLNNPNQRPDVRKKISDFRKGKKIGGFKTGEFKHSEETKEKMRRFRTTYLTSGRHKYKDTSIEILIEKELTLRNIYFLKQTPLCEITIPDFFLPEDRVVIYCDGDYWHRLPKAIERDSRQNNVLRLNGFNVYRFWEKDIRLSPSKCIDKITLIR